MPGFTNSLDRAKADASAEASLLPRPDSRQRSHVGGQRRGRCHRGQLIDADVGAVSKGGARPQCRQHRQIAVNRGPARIAAGRRDVHLGRIAAAVQRRNVEASVCVRQHGLRQQRGGCGSVPRSAYRIQLDSRAHYGLLAAMNLALHGRVHVRGRQHVMTRTAQHDKGSGTQKQRRNMTEQSRAGHGGDPSESS